VSQFLHAQLQPRFYCSKRSVRGHVVPNALQPAGNRISIARNCHLHKPLARLLFARVVSSVRDFLAIGHAYFSSWSASGESKSLMTVNQKQRDLMLVRCTAMQVDVIFRHLPSSEIIYRNEATD